MKIHELGHVVLYVTDLKRSADFYKYTLGFREIARQNGAAVFSSGRTHHELLLLEVGGEIPKHQNLKPGLYHIGFKIGEGHSAIKEVLKELREKNVHIVGTADHGVTHSIYILDPDNNELELYADISDEWKKDHKAILQPTKYLDLE